MALEETDREFSNKLVALSFRSLMKSSTNEEKKRENRRVEGTRKEDYFNSLSFNSTFVKKEGGRKRDIYILEYTPFNGMINPRSLYERKL